MGWKVRTAKSVKNFEVRRVMTCKENDTWFLKVKMNVYAVHTWYHQPYTYDGEHHSCHSLKLFSTLQLAQAYAQQAHARKKSAEIETLTLDDPNSAYSWIQDEN